MEHPQFKEDPRGGGRVNSPSPDWNGEAQVGFLSFSAFNLVGVFEARFFKAKCQIESAVLPRPRWPDEAGVPLSATGRVRLFENARCPKGWQTLPQAGPGDFYTSWPHPSPLRTDLAEASSGSGLGEQTTGQIGVGSSERVRTALFPRNCSANKLVQVECKQRWVMGQREGAAPAAATPAAAADGQVVAASGRWHHREACQPPGYHRPTIIPAVLTLLGIGGFRPATAQLSVASPTPLLLAVLCLFVANVQVAGACEDYRCAADFTRILDSGKVLVSSNLPYCFLLEQYHSITTMVANHRKEYKCFALLERHRNVIAGAEQGSGAIGEPYGASGQTEVSSGRCLYPYHHQKGASGYRFCSVFGDPHIRTLNGQHETCLTLGAWPLLDNSYFAVQVTNEPAGATQGASCIGKITVVVKSLTGCTEQKMYEATREFLPSSFVDGTTTSDELLVEASQEEGSNAAGESASQTADSRQYGRGKGASGLFGAGHRPAVMIREFSPNEHIEIYIRYISTRLTVRLTNGYLLFSVKIPEEIVAQKSTDNSLQLCLTGCPASERVEYKEVLADPEYFLKSIGLKEMPMKRADAEATCREAGASDFFFDSCVFDLLVTGDERFKMSSVLALRDIRLLYPPYVRNYEMNRTNLQPYDVLATIERSKELMTIFNPRDMKGRSSSYSGATAGGRRGWMHLPLWLCVALLLLIEHVAVGA
uniref:Repulsive guidance molecule A n=1 Tax=Trichuris muris TaxID=70415 RepID=A0A5S6QCS9_TRIMR